MAKASKAVVWVVERQTVDGAWVPSRFMTEFRRSKKRALAYIAQSTTWPNKYRVSRYVRGTK